MTESISRSIPFEPCLPLFVGERRHFFGRLGEVAVSRLGRVKFRVYHCPETPIAPEISTYFYYSPKLFARLALELT